MALDPYVVVGLGLNAVVCLVLGGFALRHPHLGLPISFYLFCVLEGVLIVMGLPWAQAAPLLPLLLVMVLGISGGMALVWGRKEWVIAALVSLGATIASLFAVYPPDLAVLLLLGGITVTSAILCMESEEVMHAVYYLGAAFLGIAGIFLLLAAEFLWIVQILIYVGAVTILMSFAIMLTRRQIIVVEAPKQPGRPQGVQGRGLDWFLKTTAVALFFGSILFPLIEPVWPLLPDSTPAAGIDAQGPTKALAQALFGDYLSLFLLTTLVLFTALIGGIFLAKEDAPPDDQASRPRAGMTVPPLPPAEFRRAAPRRGTARDSPRPSPRPSTKAAPRPEPEPAEVVS